MPVDLFAAALGEELSDDELPVVSLPSPAPRSAIGNEPQGAPPATPPRPAPTPGEVQTPAASPAPATGGTAENLPAGGLRLARMKPRPAGKGEQARKSRRLHPSTKLQPVEPEAGRAITTVATAFIPVVPGDSAKGNSTGKGKRAHATEATAPVPLWPQYTIEGQPGRFLVLAASEKWVADTMWATRKHPKGRGTGVECAGTFRSWVQNVTDILGQMLRTAMAEVKATGATGFIDDEEDADSPPEHHHNGPISGFSIRRVLLVNATIAGCTLTLVNSARIFIISLNEDSFAFIQEKLPAILVSAYGERRTVS